MARINTTVPDKVAARARAAGLDLSRVASAAPSDGFDRLDRIAALDTDFAELEAELRPAPSTA